MASDSDDIKIFFENIAKKFDGVDEGMQGMLQMLVSEALSYRDKLMFSTGEALTVAETCVALDCFMEVLKTHRIPDGLPRRVHDLVVIWLESLKERITN